MRLGPLPSGSAQRAAQIGVAYEPLDAGGQIGGVVGRRQEPGLAVANNLGDAAAADSDDRQARGHGLDDNTAKRFVVSRVNQQVDLRHDLDGVGNEAGPDKLL